MAIGDRIPTELIVPTVLSDTATTRFTNPGTTYRTQMPAITLSNTGSSTRTITIYKNGTATTNQILSSIQLGPGASTIIDFGAPLIFTGTQTLAAKQDVGTDVNIYSTGVVEQIS